MTVDPGLRVAPDKDPPDGDGHPDLGVHDDVDQVAGFSAYIRLTSIDPTRKPTLWGGGRLIRSWGRSETRGRSLQTDHEDRASAQPLIVKTLRLRAQHRYEVIEVV